MDAVSRLARVPPPVAPRRPVERVVHGVRRVDPYAWMRRRDDPALRRWLEQENRYARAVLEPLTPLREALYAEILGRIRQTDTSAPVPDGGWLYYERTEAGRQYAIHCRRRADDPGAPEAVILDENRVSEGHAYCDVGLVEPSPDHRLLAWAVDTRGDEAYELFVSDLDTGRVVDGPIARTSASVAWASDSQTLFYAVVDDTQRPWRVMRHRVGEDVARDVVVFEDPDRAFHVSLRRTRSGRLIVIECESRTTSESHLLDAGDPQRPPRCVAPRRRGVEYVVEHRFGDAGERLYLLTNDAAREFRVVSAPLDRSTPQYWEDVVAHDPNVRREAIDAFARWLVVWEREAGLPQVRVIECTTGRWHRVEFDEPVWTVAAGENRVYDTDTLRMEYASPVTPDTVIDYDMATRRRTVRKRRDVIGYDADRYAADRIHAVAPDGARVPVTIVRRRDVPADGRAPALLYGYGAYGVCIEASFSVARVSLLDRGVVYAIAHVRGGGELGRAWYEAGRLARKPNTFSDFIACAEHLVRERHASPRRLACTGGSAGGLLVGAALNVRPELWAAALVHVPFVDVVETMLDPDLPLTVAEYEEWGDPRREADFRRLLSYSPVDNVRPAPYPPMLVTAGLYDTRVQVWEPARWVARLREASTSGEPVLLHVDMHEGHGGASGRYDAIGETARDLAFVLDALDAAERLPEPVAGRRP